MGAPATRGWAPAAPEMILAGDDVHVWRAPLDGSADVLAALEATLSTDEIARADRFHFAEHRRRYVCARGVLRQLAGRYLGVAPASLVFAYSDYGKPRLAGPHEGRLWFNVSHSEDLAVFAFSRRGEIGVDVEAIRPLSDRDRLASQMFSPDEAQALARHEPQMKDEAFFTCWTRKEAYVKAIGEGLSRPLDGFAVTFARDEAPALRVIDDAGESARWSLYGLSPHDAFAAALVTEGPREVCCWQWQAKGGSDGMATE